MDTRVLNKVRSAALHRQSASDFTRILSRMHGPCALQLYQSPDYIILNKTRSVQTAGEDIFTRGKCGHPCPWFLDRSETIQTQTERKLFEYGTPVSK